MCADEPNYWWFELAILLNKTMMCGGLVVLNPGSPTQVVCGILIMMFHLLLILKLAPYTSNSEDWSSFASSLGLTLTYIGALVKMIQEQQRDEFDPDELSYAATAMDILPVACVSVVVLIMIFVDCGLLKFLRGKKGVTGGKTDGKKKGSLTQVQPVKKKDESNINQFEKTKTMKQQRTVLEGEEDIALKNWDVDPVPLPVTSSQRFVTQL